MIKARREQEDPMDQVSVTNLIDVLLVLLIIFMITARTFAHENRSLTLPSTAPDQGPVSGQLEISVDSEGAITMERNNLDLEGLRIRLSRLSLSERSHPVIIRADGRVSYGRLTRILDIVRASGVQSVNMAVKGKGGP